MLSAIDYYIRKYNVGLRELGSLYLTVKDFIEFCSTAQVNESFEGFLVTHLTLIPFTSKELVESVASILPFLDRMVQELLENLVPLYNHFLLTKLSAQKRKLISLRLQTLFAYVDGLYQCFVRCRWCMPIAHYLELTEELAPLMKSFTRAVNYLTLNQLTRVRGHFYIFLCRSHIDIHPKRKFTYLFKRSIPLIKEERIKLVIQEDRRARRLPPIDWRYSPATPTP